MLVQERSLLRMVEPSVGREQRPARGRVAEMGTKARARDGDEDRGTGHWEGGRFIVVRVYDREHMSG